MSGLRRWRRSPNQTSQHCVVQIKNNRILTIQRAKYCLACHGPERIILFFTDIRSFWSLAMALSQKFCPLNFPFIRSSSSSLICDPHDRAEVFAFLIAPKAPAFIKPLSLPSSFVPNHTFVLIITTRKIHQCLSNLNVPKPPIPSKILKSGLDLSPTSHRLFLSYHNGSTFSSSRRKAAIFSIPQHGDPSNHDN